MSQTTVQNANTVRFGSGMLEVGETVGTLVNLGAMTGINFEESWDTVSIMSDNAGLITQRIKNHQAKISGDLIEIDLENLYLIRGGLDIYADADTTPVAITNEAVTLTDTDFIRLAHKNAAGTEVASITVTSTSGGGTTYDRDADYVVSVDSEGWTGIARASVASDIADNATVYVDYTYTPVTSKTLTTGGLATIDPRVVRITNTDENGKIFRITVYKATNETGIKLELQSDDADDPNSIPIELTGTLDTTKTAGAQLFEIYDEQGVL